MNKQKPKAMNKKELADKIAELTDTTKKDALEIVEAAIKTIEDTLSEGNSVKLQGFGTFEVRDRAAKKGRNPSTGEEIDIKACKAVGFKSSEGLKKKVNG